MTAKRRWPTVVAAIASALVLVVTIAGGAYSALFSQLQGNVASVDVSDQIGVDVGEPIPVTDEAGNYTPVNVLLMGSDTREGKGNRGFGSAAEFGGQRSDTTILLHIAADRKSAIALSIPRDTWIKQPVCKKDGQTVGGDYGRFNEVIQIGGPGCTLKAVREMTGVDVRNFMLVDFGGFKRIVNALGGVEVCLTEAVNDPQSGLKLPAGKSLVDGDQALAFVRARKSLGDGSDIQRIRRQQAFISSLIQKITSNQVLLNPVSLYDLLNSGTESLTADKQFADLNTLRDLALSAKDMQPSDISFVTLPWQVRSDGATVEMVASKADPIFEAMRNDAPWPPKKDPNQPLLKTPPSSIRVNVLNGSGVTGQARIVADALKAEGYVVESVGNADADTYETSIVQYHKNWDQSAKTLTYAVEGAVSEQDRKAKGTLTLIVGKNYTQILPVKISKAATDYTTNLNTADESYCAS